MTQQIKESWKTASGDGEQACAPPGEIQPCVLEYVKFIRESLTKLDNGSTLIPTNRLVLFIVLYIV
jgi:predicted RNA-binding protein with PUA domain